MLFNSYVFPIFFALTYAAYLLLRKHYRAQNRLLLVASYIFYGYWDYRFLALLLVSTFVDYHVGLVLARTKTRARRRLLLAVSVVSNLSILGAFKYFGFFAESFAQALRAVGIDPGYTTIHIVLPVGISFYTFQTLSYTIDVYRRTLQPTRSFADFALFVAFFPQLVAGPIERAKNLLPQIGARRQVTSDKINAALFLIIWGYFKKIVIADNVAVVANTVFNNHQDYQGLDLVLGALAFTVQIYCDFSGYSDIARGLARLLGFELCLNFRLPYLATSPSDFWMRWHISLSSWLRDYLYIPLGGNRRGTALTYRNLMLTMLLGGLWHGAAWNFVFWGLYHGIILVIYRAWPRSDRNTRPTPAAALIGRTLLMFILTVFGWILFRARSAEQVWHFVTHMGVTTSAATADFTFELAYFTLPLLVMHAIQHVSRDLLIVTRWPTPARVGVYSILIAAMCIFGVRDTVEFIYFQF